MIATFAPCIRGIGIFLSLGIFLKVTSRSTSGSQGLLERSFLFGHVDR